MLSRLLYSTPFFISSFSMFVAVALAVRRRNTRGAWYLVAMCLSAAAYAFFEGTRYLSTDLQTDMFLTYAQYLGVASMIPFAILFALNAFGYESLLNRFTISFLSIFAVAIIALAWTDPLHHLVYADYRLDKSGPFPIRHYTPGILWWVIVIYHYLLMAAFTLMLFRLFRTSAGLHRIQAGLFLSGTTIVWIVHAVFIAGYTPVPGMDTGPLAFIIFAVLMVVGFLKYNFLDTLPIARSEIFRKLSDPIVVLDPKNNILDLNPAAEKLLGVRSTRFFGYNIAQLLERHPEALQSLREGIEREVPVTQNGRQYYFLLRYSPVLNKRGGRIGCIVIFQDISERKQAEETLRKTERLRGVLEMAGAVCHDLSQPAMASGGYAELIQMSIPESDPLHAPLTRLIDQVEKLGDINKKLLRVTRYTPK